MAEAARAGVRYAYFAAGVVALVLGVIGAFLPLLPTVPFLILAAFCFSRSNPAWERRLLEHPVYGPHIRSWRERGAIGRRAKLLAITMLAGSATLGLALLDPPHAFVPLGVAVVCGAWIGTRPSA